MKRNKVIVGVVPNYDNEKDASIVQVDYLKAIDLVGGIPLITASIINENYYDFITDECNGFLLTGSGSDIDPNKYGQEVLSVCGKINKRREECDWVLLKYIFEKKIPLLGICHGLQEINVYCGGSLYQDISTQVSRAIQHRQLKIPGKPTHKIKINKESILFEILGESEIMVNSRHHQAIDKCGKNLIPIAYAEDGLIEAIIYNDPAHFVLGVQWHPESMIESDENSYKIFQYFVNQCLLK